MLRGRGSRGECTASSLIGEPVVLGLLAVVRLAPRPSNMGWQGNPPDLDPPDPPGATKRQNLGQAQQQTSVLSCDL